MTEDEAKAWVQEKVNEAMISMKFMVPNNDRGRMAILHLVQKTVQEMNLPFPWYHFQVVIPPINEVDKASRTLRVDLELSEDLAKSLGLL